MVSVSSIHNGNSGSLFQSKVHNVPEILPWSVLASVRYPHGKS